MKKLDLAGRWNRYVGDRLVDFIEVPGSYEPVGECRLEHEFPWNTHADPPEARYFLVTEGVLASADFFLNGKEIGRAGPWVPYRFEIPRATLKDANLLQARVKDMSERFGLTPGRRMDAGLIRDISIERRPSAFIESVLLQYDLSDNRDRAKCSVHVEIEGDTRGTIVEAVLENAETGHTAASSTAAAGEPVLFELNEPLMWSPETPHLYRLRVAARGGHADGDEQSDLVGFRRITIQGRDFFLNGKRLILKGVCRHEFMASYPFSPAAEAVERDLALIKHAGFNYIRLVHAPQAAIVPRIAARLGLLVSEEPGACFMDLGDEQIASASIESMRRTVLRDRNCPSVFAWYIYNECNPDAPYARRIAEVIRGLDPSGRPIGMADCSGKIDKVKEMVKVGGLSMYGINHYSTDPGAYLRIMESYTDLPLVISEWGGCLGQGNPRTLADLCATFVRHSREDAKLRLSGSSFWAWQDYPEHTRGGPATIDGWTIEGLIDRQGNARHDLLALSMMCFETDHPSSRRAGPLRVMLHGPRRKGTWSCVDLDGVSGNQSMLEQEVEKGRAIHGVMPPTLGALLVDGIEFAPRNAGRPASPLLVGKGREELIIPVQKTVRAIAVLGHVDLKGGYPGSDLFSVHTGGALAARAFGEAASEYLFEFDDGTVSQPLTHGEHILRGNGICRWWKVDPQSSFTRCAIESVVHPSYEIQRIDLWEKHFEEPRALRTIRWKLHDPDSIQAIFAISVQEM